MAAPVEVAERIVAGEWKRQQRRHAARERLDDLLVGLCVLIVCAATAVWLVGVFYSVRLLIGALQ